MSRFSSSRLNTTIIPGLENHRLCTILGALRFDPEFACLPIGICFEDTLTKALQLQESAVVLPRSVALKVENVEIR